MSNNYDEKMLKQTVWKLLDILDSHGLAEETGQEFPLISINCRKCVEPTIGVIIQNLKKYSDHVTDEKYQVKYVMKY